MPIQNMADQVTSPCGNGVAGKDEPFTAHHGGGALNDLATKVATPADTGWGGSVQAPQLLIVANSPELNSGAKLSSMPR